MRLLTLILISSSAICDSACGQARIELHIEADGSTSFFNPGGESVSFDGYTIACEPGCLDPVGWVSISDAVAADLLGVIGSLGSGAVAFGEANPQQGNLSELNISGGATLQPGASWALGRPIAGTPSETNRLALTGALTLTMSSVDGTRIDTCVGPACIPEPSTVVLAVLALCFFLLRW